MITPGLTVLFCGINLDCTRPGAATTFRAPGNRFWPALHLGGFTPRLFGPAEEHDLLPLGYGITNLVQRASARADELTKEEYEAGGSTLTDEVSPIHTRRAGCAGRWRLPQRLWRTSALPLAASRRQLGTRSFGCCPTPAALTPITRWKVWRRSLPSCDRRREDKLDVGFLACSLVRITRRQGDLPESPASGKIVVGWLGD